jgi:hypothetical protein
MSLVDLPLRLPLLCLVHLSNMQQLNGVFCTGNGCGHDMGPTCPTTVVQTNAYTALSPAHSTLTAGAHAN